MVPRREQRVSVARMMTRGHSIVLLMALLVLLVADTTLAGVTSGTTELVAGDDAAADRAALEELYYTARGDRWLQADGWLEGDDVCAWFGVGCVNVSALAWRAQAGSRDGVRVASLQLPHNELAGAMPVALFNMTYLRHLDLSFNALNSSFARSLPPVAVATDDGAAVAPGAAGLETLNLAFNELRGPMPGSLCHFGNMTHMNVSHNRATLRIPACLGNETALRTLALDHNLFSGQIPVSFAHAESMLEYVDLSYNYLELIPLVLWQLPPYELRMVENLFPCPLPQWCDDGVDGNGACLPCVSGDGGVVGNEGGALSGNSLGFLLFVGILLACLFSAFLFINGRQEATKDAVRSASNMAIASESDADAVRTKKASFGGGGGGSGGAELSDGDGDSSDDDDGGDGMRERRPSVGTGARRKSKQLDMLGDGGGGGGGGVADMDMNASLSMVSYDEVAQFLVEENFLDTGGTGDVYVGEWAGAQVALKKMKREVMDDEALWADFRSELVLMSSLQHPNILHVHGATFDTDMPMVIISDYCANGSLYSVLHAEERAALLSWHDKLRVATQVASAMVYLHSRNPPIIHRDLKSLNILLDDDFNAQVADFGISHMRRHTLVSPQRHLGSPAWTAPEVLRGTSFNHKSDVYGFGVVLWELLTEAIPWENEAFGPLVGRVAFKGERLPVPRRAAGCPELLLTLMEACWADDPMKRPDFEQVFAVLNDCLETYVEEDYGSSEPLSDDDSDVAAATAIGGSGIRVRSPYDEEQRSVVSDAISSSSPSSALPPPSTSTTSGGGGGVVDMASGQLSPVSGEYIQTDDEVSELVLQRQDSATYRRKHPWEILFSEIELGEQIGAGAFGEVFSGRWKSLAVAVKIVKRVTTETIAKLEQEAKLMSELRHPNIVQFLGACLHMSNVAIVTEYMADGNLQQILRANADRVGVALSWPIRLKWAKDVALGMCYLHAYNAGPVLHRDLKSSNILIDKMVAKINDFGLSRVFTSDKTMTNTGCLRWTAPEILVGDRYTEKIDVYSFGIVLWELLTYARMPYTDTPTSAVINEVIRGVRPEVPERPDCTPEYLALMRACWSQSAESRPSFDEIVRIIDSCLPSLHSSF